jgi:hypothetical protein
MPSFRAFSGYGFSLDGIRFRPLPDPPKNQEAEQVETRNPYQPPCLHAPFYIQPQPRDRRAPSLIGLRAL